MKTKLSKKKFVENLRIIGDLFLHLQEATPDVRVKMKSPKFHPCGTTACFAGHFALAISPETMRGQDIEIEGKNIVCFLFMDSADIMAQFMGFNHMYDLQDWAKLNPNLWGNEYGAFIFNSRRAFGIKGREPTLKEIGLHWHGVADRVEELG